MIINAFRDIWSTCLYKAIERGSSSTVFYVLAISNKVKYQSWITFFEIFPRVSFDHFSNFHVSTGRVNVSLQNIWKLSFSIGTVILRCSFPNSLKIRPGSLLPEKSYKYVLYFSYLKHLSLRSHHKSRLSYILRTVKPVTRKWTTWNM